MRYIFLDCGANVGSSVKMFRDNFPKANEYIIHSFEASPRIKQKVKGENLFFHPVAVWIKDEIVDFYIGGSDTNPGCSLIKEKKTGNLKSSVKVKAIDFSKWVLENFTADDYIILKLDIEGAEYKVLDKMFADKSIDLIREFYVDWHWSKINMSKADHDKYVAALVAKDLSPKGWETESNSFGKICLD